MYDYNDEPFYIRRQHDMLRRYPGLQRLVMQQPIVRAWLDAWSHKEPYQPKDEALIDLVLIVVNMSEQTQKILEKELMSRPKLIFKNQSKID